MTARPTAASAFLAVLLGLTGCGGPPPAPKDAAEKDKAKGDPKPPPKPADPAPPKDGKGDTPAAPSAPPAVPKLGDADPAAQAAVAALKDLGEGTFPADRLTPAFRQAIGKPAPELADAAFAGWRRRARAAVTPLGPIIAGYPTPGGAVFVGAGADRRYLLRMADPNGWKVDWLQATAVQTDPPAGADPDALLKDFAAVAFLCAVADARDPDTAPDRAALAWALLSADFRKRLDVAAFGEEAKRGFEYSGSKLQRELDDLLGGPAKDLTRTVTGPTTYRVEVGSGSGGARPVYLLTLARDPARGWVVDDFKLHP